MRKLVVLFTVLCISALCLSASEAARDRNERSQHSLVFRTMRGNNCDYGCVYGRWVDENYNLGRVFNDKRMRFKSKSMTRSVPLHRFYLKSRGRRRIEVLAIAPSSYSGWGCGTVIGSGWSPRRCNRIPSSGLGSGQRIVMEMLYSDSVMENKYDFCFIDTGGNERKFKRVKLDRYGTTPTLVYKGDSLRVTIYKGGSRHVTVHQAVRGC